MASDPQLPDVPRLLALRFSLRSLLLWMTLLCGLLALLVSVSPGPAIVIASVALLIGAHVVGNALGTRLRDQAPRITDAPTARRPAAMLPAASAAAALPVTSLRNKQRLSRTTPVVAGVAALLGALVGGVVLAWFNHPQGTLAGLLVGGLSCGFLGGFVGFLAGSFLEIFGPAWSEAASLAPDPPRRKRPARVGPGSGRPTLLARLSRPLRWFARR